MTVDKIIKWNETKSISIAHDICSELYDELIKFCDKADSELDDCDDIIPLIIKKV